jgi:hypothetical protein
LSRQPLPKSITAAIFGPGTEVKITQGRPASTSSFNTLSIFQDRYFTFNIEVLNNLLSPQGVNNAHVSTPGNRQQRPEFRTDHLPDHPIKQLCFVFSS